MKLLYTLDNQSPHPKIVRLESKIPVSDSKSFLTEQVSVYRPNLGPEDQGSGIEKSKNSTLFSIE